jgi:hypothetical protein
MLHIVDDGISPALPFSGTSALPWSKPWGFLLLRNMCWDEKDIHQPAIFSSKIPMVFVDVDESFVKMLVVIRNPQNGSPKSL